METSLKYVTIVSPLTIFDTRKYCIQINIDKLWVQNVYHSKKGVKTFCLKVLLFQLDTSKTLLITEFL